jgi:2-hydroxy-6-oxonona-2,4-dienedioate hydrolase
MHNKYSVKRLALANGETLGYREAGAGGPALVLLHGNMTSSKHLEILMDQLEDEFKIYAPDMRGFGVSTYNQHITSLQDFADDLKLWVDGLSLRGFTLAGWSTGGGVAMQFAADHPDYVDKLVLIESVGIKGYRLPLKRSSVKPLAGLGKSISKSAVMPPKEPAAKFKLKLPDWDLGKFKDLNLYPSREFVRTIWDNTVYTNNRPGTDLYEEYIDDSMTQRNVRDVTLALFKFNISNAHNGISPGNGWVHRISAPTLVLQGDRDLVVPPQIGAETAVALGAKAKLVILEDCGHSPFIDCLDAMVAQIKIFIQGTTVRELSQQARKYCDQARACLIAGDWAGCGQNMEHLNETLSQLEAIAR